MAIVEFIEHRWEEAREELRKRVDCQTFAGLENELKLEKVGLPALSPKLLSFKWPVLASAWHRFLEECLEMTMAWHSMSVALSLLAPGSTQGRSDESLGKEAIYHFRAWFAFALTTAERLEAVINRWIELRLGTTNEATGLKKVYANRLYEEFKKPVEVQRNSYLHGGRRSWAAGITEDGLWEMDVFVRLVPELLLSQFVYPGQLSQRNKVYRRLKVATLSFENKIGGLLQDLEASIERTGSSATSTASRTSSITR